MRRASVLFTGLGTAAAAMALLVASASGAAPFGPRVPQVPFNGASLQAYLGGTIDVYADQLDGHVWTASISGDATFTLMLEMTINAGANSIGVYNTAGPPAPPLFQIFPAAAAAGWFATAHFGGGNLVVTLFDPNSVIQGQSSYPGVDANAFGFYLQGPGGTFYSEDARNPGGNPQILVYPGTGQNSSGWWMCFEDTSYDQGDKDFDDVVLLLQAVVPTAVDGNTWGRIKSLYRK